MGARRDQRGARRAFGSGGFDMGTPMGYGYDVGRSTAGTGVYVMEKMEKPQKQALNLTPRAAQHIARLMREKNHFRPAFGREKGRLRGDGIHDGVCVLGRSFG